MIDLENSRVTVLGSSQLDGSSRAAQAYRECDFVFERQLYRACKRKENAQIVLLRHLTQ
jgi:hypothetical protein